MSIEGYPIPEEETETPVQGTQETNENTENVTTEGSNNPEQNESSNESTEEMAEKKFDAILNRYFEIQGGKRYEDNIVIDANTSVKVIQKPAPLEFATQDGRVGEIEVLEGFDTSYNQMITIHWVIPDINNYTLEKRDGKYTLLVGGTGNRSDGSIQTINNLTPEELLNDVLPNFEKRLNEAETQKKEKRRDDLKRANEYAHRKDQNEADDLLNNLG